MDIANLREQFLQRNLRVLRCPTPSQLDSPYLPIALKALMLEEQVTFTLYLKVSEGANREIKFMPYLVEGEILNRSWLELLKQVGIERLYFHERDMDRMLAYLNNHLLLTSGDPAHYPERYCILREHLTVSLTRTFKNPNSGGVHMAKAKNSLENLLGFMGKKGFPWKLMWEMLYRDYTLYNHSVNVSLMGMAFSLFLGKSHHESLNLGLAGLFHDLGLTCLNEEIVQKTLPLSPEERELLNRHPSLGYRLLQNNSQVPLDTLRLVLEHHENADGSGYPQGLPLSRQHPCTRILFILEVYDGLITFRPYRPAYTPFAALKILQEQRGKRGLACDPPTLKRFIEFLALT